MTPEKKYDGWLVSNNFLKRSAAVFGHYFVFSLIVGFIMFIIIMILGLSFFSIFMNSTGVKEWLNNPKVYEMIVDEINKDFHGEVSIGKDGIVISTDTGEVTISGAVLDSGNVINDVIIDEAVQENVN